MIALLREASWPYAWSPDSAHLAAASKDGSILLWRSKDGTLEGKLTGAGKTVRELQWSPSGAVLAARYWADGIALWDVAAKKRRATIFTDGWTVRDMRWSPERNLLAVALALGEPKQFGFSAPSRTFRRVGIWDESGNAVQTVSSPGHEFTTMAWSPAGDRLAVGGQRKDDLASRSLLVWNATTHKSASVSDGHSGSASTVVWSPDGKTIALGGSDGTVTLWSTNPWRMRATLQGFNGYRSSFAFLREGQLIATTSKEGELIFWHGRSGRKLLTCYSRNEGRDWLAVTPDGYFTGSPGGIEHIQWRVGSKLHAVEKFRRRFERPDRVRKALESAARPR